MPVAKKVELDFKLDPSSQLGSFVEWYKVRYRTTNENGRKRIGNARKAIQDYLESSITGVASKELNHFKEAVEEFKEDTKLPAALQNAKNNLSPEDFAQFKSLYEKSEKEAEKNKSAT